MKRNSIIIQLLEKEIVILNKKQLYKYQTLSVDNYKVINSTLLKKDFLKIINNQKLNNNILTDNITIIIDTSYTIDEQENIKKLFKELSFNEIKFIYINDLLLKKEQELNILVSDSLIKIYYMDKTYPLYYYNDKLCETLDMFLKPFTQKYNIKTIKMFGHEKSINQIINTINIHGVELYKYANPSMIPIILLK